MNEINYYNSLNHNEMGNPHPQYTRYTPTTIGSYNGTDLKSWIRLWTIRIGSYPVDNETLNGMFARFNFNLSIIDTLGDVTANRVNFVGRMAIGTDSAHSFRGMIDKEIKGSNTAQSPFDDKKINLYYFYKNINSTAYPVYEVKIYLNFPTVSKGIRIVNADIGGYAPVFSPTYYPTKVNSQIQQTYWYLNNIETDWLSDTDMQTDTDGYSQVGATHYNNSGSEASLNQLSGQITLSEVTGSGNYYINNATFTDGPTSISSPVYGLLEVINMNVIFQKITSIDNSAIYIRNYSGSPITWHAWRQI
ncbi:hypothetical protein ATX69_09605 [Oenococcus oeni]|uniref:pyocin knob domain-containing protein n=1 Tax=Oenococcus oeni TaxID=1247 RepID=UPI0008F8E060|nr:pyocin knob domain-containing protein [Oenococcus oeni]OIM32240.1 hypothetical protein ATX69_09605 [Oenococcus oeni]